MAKQYTGSQVVVIPVEPLSITLDVVDELPTVQTYVLVDSNTGLDIIDSDTGYLLIAAGVQNG